MTYDVFTFYNELDMLDFRLHHAYDHVDKIVIVEGDRLYPGQPYESNFLKHYDRYKWAADKIIHVVVPLEANPIDRWQNEAIQRSGMITQLDLKPNDVVFISCVDEIIKTELYDMVAAPVMAVLHLANYYYYFNGKDVGDNPVHPMPIVFSPDSFSGSLHSLWDSRHSLMALEDAGWHFSYVGGTDLIKAKLSAFSHVEYDNDKIKAGLEANIAAGADIFGRADHKFQYVPIDDSFPAELVNNQKKYKEFIHASNS